MIVLAIDPGYRESAFLQWDETGIVSHGIESNEQLLGELMASKTQAVLVLEEMQLFSSNYGIGREIFDSVFWSGRFAQAWAPRSFDRLLRSRVRAHLGASKGGDAAVRAALIDRFGPYREVAIGTSKQKGPLYGIKSHEWSALAIAITYWDQHREMQEMAHAI